MIENGKLRMLMFDGGYVDFSGDEPRYCWYTKDHLGSVRAVADAEGNVFASYAYGPYGEDFVAERIVGEDQVASGDGNGSSLTYQPDGGTTVIDGLTPSAEYHLKPGVTLPGTTPAVTYTANESPDWQPYKFSGKESLTRVGLKLYDFGARMYSPSNMRWMTMDPLAEKYYSISPYAYCAGNPINMVDPDGSEIQAPPAPNRVIGTPLYYVWRHYNFIQRNPGITPPTYYIEYGYKYCKRFKYITSCLLSDKGKVWCNEVLLSLQKSMETELGEKKGSIWN